MREVCMLLLLVMLLMAVVQAVPWWSDIGATHGARAAPLTLAELAGHFPPASMNDKGKGFPWRSLESADEGNELQPRSRKVPTVSVMDEDHDDAVSPAEWTDYVEKLKTAALAIISKTSDPIAKRFLQDIAFFHYENLCNCIREQLMQSNSTEFGDIAAEIESNCYVRFRYSLFAGPPPFELVAKKRPAVSAHEVELWFTHQVDIARSDVKDKRVLDLTHEDEMRLEDLALCVYKELDPWGETGLDRNDFYGALVSVIRCA